MTTDAAAERPGFLVRHRLWILLLITVAGGVARFATLDRPPLWGDEALTYYRTSGQFQDLLDILQYHEFNGFPPLHYEAYWALRQAHPLTPRAMRVIPALAGTLMIPAMYFLAVQIGRRRVALLVALFTACSAYMMAYSHDAKMYMACWLFVALHAGCLLWWLRIGRSTVGRVAWLAWVASGLAAVGLHHAANLLLPVEIFVLLSFPRSPDSPGVARRIGLFLLGAAVILAGPLGYLVGFNRIGQTVAEQGFAWGNDKSWVEQYNAGRGPADLALYTATAHLYSWEWPLKPGRLVIDADVLHGLMTGGAAILLLVAIGTIPWRRTRTPGEPSGSAAGPPTFHEVVVPLVDDDPPAQAWWRQFLWLGAWLVPVAYGWYCISVKHFGSPIDAQRAIGQLFDEHWLALIAEIALLAALAHVWPRLPLYLAVAIPVIALLGLNAVLLNAGISEPWRGREWHDRYWAILTDWWRWLTAPRMLLMLLGALPVIAWHCSAGRPQRRAVRLAQFLGVAAVLYGACWLAWWLMTYRVASLAGHFARDRHLDDAAAVEMVWSNWRSAWMPRYLGILWPAVAIVACAMIARLPGRPLRYAAVVLLLGLNLAQATARLVAGSEPPLDRVVVDIMASQEARGGRPTSSGTRTYLLNLGGFSIGAPGSLSAFSHPMRYYLSQASDRHITPHDFAWSPMMASSIAKVWGIHMAVDLRPGMIADDVHRAPQVRRLIFWERLPQPTDPSWVPEIVQRIGPGWRRASDRTFIGRDHWTWNNYWALRRQEYVRDGAATAPTTAP